MERFAIGIVKAGVCCEEHLKRYLDDPSLDDTEGGPSMERRLAAILAADVVGYSRLMVADEVDTLVALKSHREDLIDPTIAEHNGRTVKLMGDGAVVEFASVVDAVRCAVEIQRSMVDLCAGSMAGKPSITHQSSRLLTSPHD